MLDEANLFKFSALVWKFDDQDLSSLFNLKHFFFQELDIPYSDDFNSSWYENELDDDEQEIPIWIRGEPRFVSGISYVTTCNDVIAALINDEISSGQYSKIDEVRYSVDDYIITERWRDVESELDGNELILPIFMAWGEAQKEMKFKLKINKKKIEEGKTEKIEKKVRTRRKLLFHETTHSFFLWRFSWRRKKRWQWLQNLWDAF